jgi:hypothetical protein
MERMVFIIDWWVLGDGFLANVLISPKKIPSDARLLTNKPLLKSNPSIHL